MEIKGNPMLKQPRPTDTPKKFKNKNKYFEYHEDFTHNASECWEPKRALYELVDQGQLNCFLKQEKVVDWSYHDLDAKQNDDLNRNTEIIVTTIGGIYTKKLNA